MDPMTPEERSLHMARIRGRDTLPEHVVRGILVDAGVEFETNVAGLPGTPDVVVRACSTVVMVHGCFWHAHGCARRKPKTNRVFWEDKFRRNVERDKRDIRRLKAQGWRVLVVWECQTRHSKSALVTRLLKAVAPHRRRCHSCTRVAKQDSCFCGSCKDGEPRPCRSCGEPRPCTGCSKSSIYKRRALLRLCRECGMPAAPFSRCCPAHGTRARATTSANYRRLEAVRTELAAQELCACGKPRVKGRTRCESHLRQCKESAARRIARRKAARLCLVCPKPARAALPGHSLCAEHLEIVNEGSRQNRRRAA